MNTLLIAIAALMLCLLAAVWQRMKIPHDPSRERPDDAASIQAYGSMGLGPLFAFLRFLEIGRLKKCQPSGILLDAGCGPGYTDLAIAARYPDLKITGIDNSAEMIDLAVQIRASSKVASQVNYQVDNVQKLSFQSESVDVVFSSLSLHHWSDPEEALKECLRVLKPGGQLLFFDLRRDTPWALYYLLYFFQSTLAPAPIKRTNGGIGSIWASYTPQEMESLLKNSGFAKWRVERGWSWAYLWAKKEDI